MRPPPPKLKLPRFPAEQVVTGLALSRSFDDVDAEDLRAYLPSVRDDEWLRGHDARRMAEAWAQVDQLDYEN